MNVLVACEFSGIVRDAFAARGHYALSCDLLQTERPGPHYFGDVCDIIRAKWDLMIAHPPYTHLAVSGARWFKDKQKEQSRMAGIGSGSGSGMGGGSGRDFGGDSSDRSSSFSFNDTPASAPSYWIRV